VPPGRIRGLPLARGYRARRDGLRQLPQVPPEPAEAGRPGSDEADASVEHRAAEVDDDAGGAREAEALGRGDQRRQLLVHTAEHLGEPHEVSRERQCQQK
jgi:hypothetical protein